MRQNFLTFRRLTMSESRNELPAKNGSHDMTRREAVAKVGAAASAAGVLLSAPNIAFGKGNFGGKAMAMSHEDWQQLIGGEFNVIGHTFNDDDNKFAKKAKVKLVDVNDLSHSSDKLRPRATRSSGFSLVFEAPKRTELQSVSHTINHPRLGTFDVMIHEVCVGNDHKELQKNQRTKQHFEVVMN